MSYEMVVERMKTVPADALDEIYTYIEAVCDKYNTSVHSEEYGLAFIKKYSGRIDRDIDYKKELAEARDDKYGTAD